MRSGEVIISESAIVARSSVIGASFRRMLQKGEFCAGETVIGDEVWIGEYCVVGAGATIGERSILDHYSSVESCAVVGRECLILYRALVCCDAQIGDGCVIGGFIGEHTQVGKGCRVFGSVVHHHPNPVNKWDAQESAEDGAVLHDYVFVGFGAVISRPVSLGPRSYVCAGAVVSKPLPPLHIATGVNKFVHFKEWSGALRDSPLFLEG